MLKRTLHIDSLTCPRCSATMVVLAFLTDPAVVTKILEHLRLPTTDPPRATARVPLEQITIEGEFREEGQDEPFPIERMEQKPDGTSYHPGIGTLIMVHLLGPGLERAGHGDHTGVVGRGRQVNVFYGIYLNEVT